jgi:hypothetical protein
MFSTIEEAEKAQAMLRRFGGREFRAEPYASGGYVIYDARMPGPVIGYWEELADFLLLERRDDDRRAGLLAQARAHLAIAERRMGGGNISVDGYLVATLSCILEALA